KQHQNNTSRRFWTSTRKSLARSQARWKREVKLTRRIRRGLAVILPLIRGEGNFGSRARNFSPLSRAVVRYRGRPPNDFPVGKPNGFPLLTRRNVRRRTIQVNKGSLSSLDDHWNIHSAEMR